MSVAFDKVWIVLKQGLSPLQEDIQGADAIAGIGRQPDGNPDPYKHLQDNPWKQPQDPNPQRRRCKKCGQPLDYKDYYNSSGLCNRCQQYGGDIKRDQGTERCQGCNGSGQIPDPWNERRRDFQKSGEILGQFNRGRGLYKYNEPDPDPWGPQPYPNKPDPPWGGGRTISCPKCGGRGWVEKGSQPSPWRPPYRFDEGDAGANA